MVNLPVDFESLTRQFLNIRFWLSADVRDLLADDVVVEELGEHCVSGWPGAGHCFWLDCLFGRRSEVLRSQPASTTFLAQT